jgi:hypothetical protein
VYSGVSHSPFCSCRSLIAGFRQVLAVICRNAQPSLKSRPSQYTAYTGCYNQNNTTMNHLDICDIVIVPTIGSSINWITCSHQVWLAVCIMTFSGPSKLLRINFTVEQVISLSALAGPGRLVMILIHSCNALLESQQQEMMSSQSPHSSTPTGKGRLVQIFQ